MRPFKIFDRKGKMNILKILQLHRLCSVSNLSFSYLYILSHPSMQKDPPKRRVFLRLQEKSVFQHIGFVQVQIVHFYNALVIHAVLAVFLLTNAAAGAHGIRKAQLIIGK